jgi:hypothetical protein
MIIIIEIPLDSKIWILIDKQSLNYAVVLLARHKALNPLSTKQLVCTMDSKEQVSFLDHQLSGSAIKEEIFKLIHLLGTFFNGFSKHFLDRLTWQKHACLHWMPSRV